MEQTARVTQKTEIIAFASGKGGTGKTLMASCLGYALSRGDQRVLMIDGDPATDGLSLFLLGPEGKRQVASFERKNTFTGILDEFGRTGILTYEPHPIHRRGSGDHGISYEAIISHKGLYGDEDGLSPDSTNSGLGLAVPDLDQSLFRAGIRSLFDLLRESNLYSYVLVDTRGGFAFESTDVCALADSYIIVTEPDVTSFYQDRNLIRRISRAAQEVNSPSVLRAIIVNKATESASSRNDINEYLDLTKVEQSFRLELTKEFPVLYENTHPVPADLDALKAYKTQRMPYVVAPSSMFSYATLTAFSEIVRVVTSRWSNEQVEKWNVLVDSISRAVEGANAKQREQEETNKRREDEVRSLREELLSNQNKIDQLQREMSRMEKAFERELERTTIMLAGRKEKVSEEPDVSPSGSQGDLSKRWRVRLIVAVSVAALGLILAGFLVLQYRKQQRMDYLLQTAYDSTKSVAVRADALDELAGSYRSVRFDGISLDGAYVPNVVLPGVSLRGASLKNANLSNADLRRADLSGARLNGANLSGANLRGSQLNDTDMTDARLGSADLRGADLSGSNVTSSQLQSTVVDSSTKLPPDQELLTPKDASSKSLGNPPNKGSGPPKPTKNPTQGKDSMSPVGDNTKSAVEPLSQAPKIICVAVPSRVQAGESVQITVKSAVEARLMWELSGPSSVQISDKGSVVTVNTSGLVPGFYTVVGRTVVAGEQQASCSARFAVVPGS